jgi:hypothetical protein
MSALTLVSAIAMMGRRWALKRILREEKGY